MTRVKGLVLLASLVAVALVVAVGCGTISHGTGQNVSITSSPSAAQVEVKSEHGVVAFTGETPASVKLERKNAYTVTIKMRGYKDNIVSITHGMNSMSLLGNIFLCGGVLGLIVDFINGAAYDLEPNSINVTMVTARLDGHSELYAVLSARGDDSEIRRVVIPMIAQ